MRTFLKRLHSLSTSQHWFLVRMTGGMAVLVLAAVLVHGGGVERAAGRVALSLPLGRIAQLTSPRSMTASIFPCSWFGDCAYQSKSYYGITSNSATFTVGQPITLTWVAYTVSYGVNFSSCRQGYRDGLGNYQSYWNCSITGVGAVGTVCTDQAGYYSNDCTTTYDKAGNPITTCTNTYHDPQYCTNFSSAAPSGTVTVYPTVDTTYTFCGSYYYGTSDGQSFSVRPYPLPCPTVTVTKACGNTGFSSPWGSTSYLIYSGGEGTISPPGGGRYCVHNYSGSSIFIPANTAAEWNSFYSAKATVNVGAVAY